MTPNIGFEYSFRPYTHVSITSRTRNMATYKGSGLSEIFDTAYDRDSLVLLDGFFEIRAELLRFGLVVRRE